jgi:hypothetical protein
LTAHSDNLDGRVAQNAMNAGVSLMGTLFRPLGLHELALVWDSGMREFPPRLAHQPVFYPVANVDYARQIAANWDAHDAASGFSGFVTRFSVADGYLSGFEPHVVGASEHVEYWIPAEQLPQFNQAIEGLIAVESAFFGTEFQGHVPDKYGLRGKDAVQQFIVMAKTWDYNRMDFVCEVSANRKAMYLNSSFWAQHDFSASGIDPEQKRVTLEALRTAWEYNHIEIPLPTPLD